MFIAEYPWEDSEFFRSAPLLCNADFEREVGRLLALGQKCIVCGVRRPRADLVNPWNIASLRWDGIESAMPYD